MQRSGGSGAGDGGALAGLRILVAEDRFVVAWTMRKALEGAGATVIGPVGVLDDALAAAAAERLDAGLLDVDLKGKPSWPVARILLGRNVRILLTTGFSGAVAIPDDLAQAPRLGKPFRGEALVSAVSQLFQDGTETS